MKTREKRRKREKNGGVKMTEKILGKINFAEFGTVRDYPFLIGLQVGFKLADSCGIMDGGQYCVNISKECRWEDLERQQAITVSVEKIDKILNDAKVNYVSELKNKPVEVEIEKNLNDKRKVLW